MSLQGCLQGKILSPTRLHFTKPYTPKTNGMAERFLQTSLREWAYTISTLIPVESAGSFGDGRCCHPSGYLQIALGLLTRSHHARLALSGPAFAGSIQAFPKALYCLAHHQNPFADSTSLIMEMVSVTFHAPRRIFIQRLKATRITSSPVI